MKTSAGNTEMFNRVAFSPFLFLLIIEFIMTITNAMDDVSFGVEWGQKRLADLEFADYISALNHTLSAIQAITNFKMHLIQMLCICI